MRPHQRRDTLLRPLLRNAGSDVFGDATRPTARQFYAPVAGATGDEHLPVAKDRVPEGERGVLQVSKLRAKGQLVIEEGRLMVAKERLHHDEAVALLLQLLVGEAGGT